MGSGSLREGVKLAVFAPLGVELVAWMPLEMKLAVLEPQEMCRALSGRPIAEEGGSLPLALRLAD